MHAAHRSAPDGVLAFDVAGERFFVAVIDGHATVRDGVPLAPADLTAASDLPTFIALADRRVNPRRAARDGALQLDGDPSALDALLTAFHLPQAVPN